MTAFSCQSFHINVTKLLCQLLLSKGLLKDLQNKIYCINKVLYCKITTATFKIHEVCRSTLYTEQKKKRNNYIPLNFEQIMIQSEIIAFSNSARDIRLRPCVQTPSS